MGAIAATRVYDRLFATTGDTARTVRVAATLQPAGSDTTTDLGTERTVTGFMEKPYDNTK